ncbi:DUF2141 domain-containing protein [Winogradskyella sp. R77965]|uniref:DUF2141 domain-containing protein n=1 Tax=Winogradskyella sp. R77965 TaxID=3093872 RepID=UPI0037DDCDAA
MNVLVKIVVALIIGFVCHQSEAQNKHNIIVTVKNANSNEGKMFIALYKTESSFLNTTYKAVKSEIKDNQCTITFEDIPDGIYAVSIFHDENNNGKLDSNFFGIPKEDYGCSNNAKGFMGPPKWEDAKFQLNKNESLTIKL